MEFLRAATLLLAALTVGLVAGVMGLYAHTIMPGLRRANDRTFVAAFQAIDTAIINPVFLGTFFGGLVFTGTAASLLTGEAYQSVFPWVIVALVLYLGVIVITLAVNVPLNDGIKVAGPADDLGDAATGVRLAFNEARWVRWNLVRLALTITAFGCLAWALVLLGRATSSVGA